MCGIVGYVGKRQAYPILIKDFTAWNIAVTTAQDSHWSIGKEF